MQPALHRSPGSTSQMRQKSNSISSTAASVIFLNFSSSDAGSDQFFLEPVDPLESPQQSGCGFPRPAVAR